MESVKISTEYITLGQFIKFIHLVGSGGMVKAILQDYKISINGVVDNRRGRKLYPGDKITIKGVGEYRVT